MNPSATPENYTTLTDVTHDIVLVSDPSNDRRRTAGGKQAAHAHSCEGRTPLQWRAKDAPIRRDLKKHAACRPNRASKEALLLRDR